MVVQVFFCHKKNFIEFIANMRRKKEFFVRKTKLLQISGYFKEYTAMYLELKLTYISQFAFEHLLLWAIAFEFRFL